MTFQRPLIGAAAAMVIAVAAPALANSEPVVINSQNRTVVMNHMTTGCQSFQNQAADPYAPFDAELTADLSCPVMFGKDAVSQASIISEDGFSGSGHSAIYVEPNGSTVWAKHLTHSTYTVTFEIFEPTPFHLTAHLSAALDCPGGYQGAKALFNFNGPNGVVHSHTLNLFVMSDTAEHEIDLDGVLQPGTYFLTVRAENYMDISIVPGDDASSFSSFDFALTLDHPEPVIVGDLNGDGVVNVFDLLLLLTAWGTCADAGNCPADLNADGRVDVFDLLQLLGNWG